MSRDVVWDGKLVCPFIAPVNKPSIAYASPVSAPGAWTVETVSIETLPTAPTVCFDPFLLVDGIRLYLWWIFNPKKIRHAWKDPGGVWTTATFYDAEAPGAGYINPATEAFVPWVSQHFFHVPSVSKLSNGMFHMMVNGYEPTPASILFQLQQVPCEEPEPSVGLRNYLYHG